MIIWGTLSRVTLPLRSRLYSDLAQLLLDLLQAGGDVFGLTLPVVPASQMEHISFIPYVTLVLKSSWHGIYGSKVLKIP